MEIISNNQILDLVQEVEPRRLRSLVERLGYSEFRLVNKCAALYKNEVGERISVPTDRSAADYAESVYMTIRALAGNDYSDDDLLNLAMLPDSNVMRYRVSEPGLFSGLLPIFECHEVIHGLKNFLLYTAAGVRTGKGRYTKIPSDAKSFLRRSHLGQTERGSYVFKVFCPSTQVIHPALEDEIPFGTQVLEACIENLAYLTSENAEIEDNPLPAALNQNVVAAIGMMKPSIGFGSASIETRILEKSKTPTKRNINLNDTTFQRAEGIKNRLNAHSKAEEELLVGYVVDLHKDRPGFSEEISRQVTLDVRFGGWRKLIMRLMPPDYKNAWLWHERDQKVRVRAKINKRTSPWTVVDLREFTVADEGQKFLFD